MRTAIFAETHNVKNLVSAVDRLRNTPEDMPRMMLVDSKPGLGKTRTIAWYCVNKGGVHVTAIEIMTPRWFLRTLVRELGEEPAHHTEAVFEQAAALITERNEPIFIDEADFLVKERIHEVLRALHDLTGVPMIFVGMEHAAQKFMRFRHLYDRFTERVQFEPLTLADVEGIAKQMCETSLSKDAVEYITSETNGNFRKVKQALRLAERLTKANNIKTITTDHLRAKLK